MKIISSKTHAILDFIAIITLAAFPDLIALTPTATTLSYTLAVIHFIMTITTDFKGGIFKLIPFKTHGYVELAVGIILLVLAFTVFKGDITDEIYFACVGLSILILFSITDYHKKLPTIL